MTHSELLAAIQLAYSKGNTRLFRMNAGFAWQGDVIEHTEMRLVLLNPRAVRMGPEGISDLVGFTGPSARFVAIEGKTGKGRATNPQTAFLNLVASHGGHAGIARSVEDACSILTGEDLLNVR